MNKLFFAVVFITSVSFARNSYTGGYSGAPGRSSCASSCHGGTGGTITVSGFPSAYRPLQAYRVVVKRNGGSMIVNYNATTRIGSTSTVAGTFASTTNTALYTGADGGVYANPHAVDSAVFQWTAPAAGTGTVNLYVATYQGTTSSSNGQSAKVTLSASEILTSVRSETRPEELALDQNYPNPFNPSTKIAFRVPSSGQVNLKVFDLGGGEVATLVNDELQAGDHEVSFSGSNLASGIYIYRLKSGNSILTKKMILTK